MRTDGSLDWLAVAIIHRLKAMSKIRVQLRSDIGLWVQTRKNKIPSVRRD
jgi:hypothetical protein